MTPQEHQDAVNTALTVLNAAIAAARTENVTVNLWILGTGPTNVGPSEVALDFVSA